MTEIDTKKTTLSTSFGGTIEKNIPEDAEWIDDAFYQKDPLWIIHKHFEKSTWSAFYHWCYT